MNSNINRLGRGLDALIPTNVDEFVAESLPQELKISKNSVIEVDTNLVEPNPNQPRHDFGESELAELAQSIRNYGILQPLIVVEDRKNHYQLVAGERRLRAAKQVGLKRVPVIIRSFNQQEQLELALIENIQRADLKPLELATAYVKLMDQFNLTHAQIANRVGKGSSTVSNTIRLLNLPYKAKLALQKGDITEGHARALLSLDNEKNQLELMRMIIRSRLTVRESEEAARRFKQGNQSTKAAKVHQIRSEFNTITNHLGRVLGTKVKVQKTAKGGKLIIEYYSQEELDRIVDQITGKNGD